MQGIGKRVKLIITILLIAVVVWFLIISPMITFHNNEQKLTDAAKRYFELNPSQLPTGERIKTVSLETLYHKSFIKGDIFVPYTSKTCSVTNSWVKVRKENGEYKYYTYLECGVLSSSVDHKGPDITLNGDKEVVVGKGEKYKDAGIKSVVDNTDGKMKTSSVTVKSTVDTSKVGTYKVTFTAFDKLNNKTEVVREVKVVQKLSGTIKSALKDNKNFKGYPEDNYIRISNMLFRVYGLDNNKNVIVVSDEDIANVNYTKLDKWLDYYYENLNDFTKKAIVESKYCNMKLTDKTLDTTKCSGYTKNRKVYIPSVVEVNNAQEEVFNFMRPHTISWVANSKDSKNAYVTRDMFYGDEADKTFLAYSTTDNYGVRPMMTLKGDLLITGGDGTGTNPYVFGDVKRAKGGSHVNERFTGEYISIDGVVYRIIKTENDGTTKIISEATLSQVGSEVRYGVTGSKKIYDPKSSLSVGYYINNEATKYVNTEKFVKHEVEVPIYSGKIIYGEEKTTKKYNLVLSAPNMYEIFSAQPQNGMCRGYFLTNSSNKNNVTGAIHEVGVPVNEEFDHEFKTNIRVVAYLNKSATISSGEGTFESPYIVK